MMIFNFIYVKFGAQQDLTNVPEKYRKFIIVRAICGWWGIAAYWSACQYIPVGIATCIDSLKALWLATLASIFLQEKLTKYEILAIFSAFVGVIVMNYPFAKF